ncbi:ATP-binding protein [Roseateles sp. P5_D6]
MRSETRTDDERQDELIQSFIYGRFEDIFLSQSLRAQVGMLLAASLIAFIWLNRTQAWPPVAWEAAVIAVTGWRMRYTTKFVRAATEGTGSMRRIAWLLAINGVLMAVPLVAFGGFDATERAAISIILLSSATASTVTTSGHRSLFLAFAAPMLIPLAGTWMFLGGLQNPSPGEWWLAGLIIVFLLFLVGLGKQVNKVFEESSKYRYGEQQLNAKLTRALQQAEEHRLVEQQLNAELTQALQRADEHHQVEQQLNAKLTLALQRADESNRAKTKFLAAASHDLRQPLHVMTVWLGVLRQSKIDEDTRGIVNKLESMNQALSKQLEGLLDISKLDADIVTPRLAPCSLDALLTGHQQAMEPVAHLKGVHLELQCDENLAVATDETLFSRILRNLTDNALKFTRRGGSVRLSLQRDGDDAVLSVADSGVGIAEKELEYVFQEFYQVASTERDRSEGLGLGLSIVRRLCALLGVQLALESKFGVGTTFKLRLPLSSLEEEPVIEIAAPEVVGLSVLVIDDELDVRESTQALLRGCNVHLAASGAEALKIAQAVFIDVILSDLRLRDGESGIDVIQQLHLVRPEAHAVIITGDTAPQRLRTVISAGIPLMIKPVDPQKVVRDFNISSRPSQQEASSPGR